MYGVINKKVKNSGMNKNDTHECQSTSCPKCGEDFVHTHAYSFNPLTMRNGPKPWTDTRKDDNF